MHYTLLYGTLIESDIALFGDSSAAVPSAHQSRYRLKLLEHPSLNALGPKLDIQTDFYQSHGRELMLYSDREFGRSVESQPWCFEVKDVVRFYWISGQSIIHYQLNKERSPELLTFWFTHIFLPAFFTLEERYDFLHAGAVEIDSQPVLFIAPSMGGKSTLTDHFIQKGHGLISDDKVPTFIENGRFMAVPAHPYHRPYRRFEDLGYRVETPFTRTRPIHALYALEKNEKDNDIHISTIRGFRSFEILLPNYLYSFDYLRAKRLKYLADMVSNIPIYRVMRPWKLEALDDVHDAIANHSRELEQKHNTLAL